MRFITNVKRAKNLFYAACLLIIGGAVIESITGNQFAYLVLLNLGSLLATLALKSEKFIKLPRPLIHIFLWGITISICATIVAAIFFWEAQ